MIFWWRRPYPEKQGAAISDFQKLTYQSDAPNSAHNTSESHFRRFEFWLEKDLFWTKRWPECPVTHGAWKRTK